MFTLAQLEGFVAVAEELHYGRAAERLSLTQPPLSRRIQLLEQSLGVALFDRVGRGVVLTAAGRRFLTDARRLLELAESAVHAARRAGSGEEGTLVLGFTAATAYSSLDDVLAGFREAAPLVDVVLREQVSGTQFDGLLSGELDLGLTRPPVPPELASLPLSREPLRVAVPESHLLARETGPVAMPALDDEPMLMYSPIEARYFHEITVAAIRRARITPRYVQYVGQVHTALALAAAGAGIALVPAAAERLGLRGVVLRPLDDDGGFPVELVAAWRPGNDNPVLPAVLEALRAWAGEAAPPLTSARRRAARGPAAS
ncbi:LysR substrate-binding domain-containing protein [Pseudonocardia nematodicida]|uniref:LysR substrate-binding domain-containing protein n=1 Tax=Pseudonocardia nematodicida TaxID=1206997 RepID=A0ABV1KFD7_9PSEU